MQFSFISIFFAQIFCILGYAVFLMFESLFFLITKDFDVLACILLLLLRRPTWFRMQPKITLYKKFKKAVCKNKASINTLADNEPHSSLKTYKGTLQFNRLSPISTVCYTYLIQD